MTRYVDLQVWTQAMDLAALVYALGSSMPRAEQFGMTSQMQRAAASVPANIAEGYQRGTRKYYARFVSIARGSLAEVETFLLLANRVGHLSTEQTQTCLDLADELSRMLTRLRQRLDAPPGPTACSARRLTMCAVPAACACTAWAATTSLNCVAAWHPALPCGSMAGPAATNLWGLSRAPRPPAASRCTPVPRIKYSCRPPCPCARPRPLMAAATPMPGYVATTAWGWAADKELTIESP